MPRLGATLGCYLLERVIATDHFVEKHAEGPPVHPVVVAFADDDLRGEVLGRPAERISLLVLMF